MKKFILLFMLICSVSFAQTTIVSDTFTEASDTLLTNHTPDIGGTWVKWSINTRDGLVREATDDLVPGDSSSSSAGFFNQASPSSAEYWVQADISGNTDGNLCGLLGRGTGNTFYQAFFEITAGDWSLQKVIAGAGTGLGSYTGDSLSPSVTRTIKLELFDASKKVYIDTVERISSADNAITATNYGGLRGRTVGLMDDFLVQEESVASTFTPKVMMF